MGITEKRTNGLITTNGIKVGTETLDTFDEIDSSRIDGSSYSPDERVGIGAEAQKRDESIGELHL